MDYQIKIEIFLLSDMQPCTIKATVVHTKYSSNAYNELKRMQTKFDRGKTMRK